MKRIAFFTYGMLSYLMFLGIYVYFAGFVGNFLVPKSLDKSLASGESGPLAWSVAVDVLLLLAFAAQHSIMARPAFKKIWTQFIPLPIERSTYVLASNLVVLLMIWQWRPLPAVIWEVRGPLGSGVLSGIFIAGWFGVPLVTLMINHFDLFGARQVWLYLQGKAYTSLPFKTPLAYGIVRHPLYVAWALFFWATPTMTAGHLLFAGLLTTYMVAASKVEERDLIAHFGKQYEDYRRRVPAFVPLLGKTAAESRSPLQLATPKSE